MLQQQQQQQHWCFVICSCSFLCFKHICLAQHTSSPPHFPFPSSQEGKQMENRTMVPGLSHC